MPYISGETAKMTGFYKNDLYDLAGTVIGIVDKKKMIDGKKNIEKEDCLLGLPSSGFHSNGYTVIQDVLFKQNNFKLTDRISECNNLLLRDILLRPTKIYIPIVYDLCSQFQVKGLVHITGGGILENCKRVLNSDLDIELYEYTFPSVFKWFQNVSDFSTQKMQSIFNCGVGMVVFSTQKDANKIKLYVQKKYNIEIIELGKVVSYL